MNNLLELMRKENARRKMKARIVAAKSGTLQVSQDAERRASEADQIAEDRAVLSSTPWLAKGVAKLNQGIPFAGEYFDEASGWVADKLGGDGAAVTEDIRSVQGAMDRQHPITSGALELTGGIASGVAAAPLLGPLAGGLKALPGGASTAGRTVYGVLGGSTAGAGEGYVSGKGHGTDERSRASEAQKRAVFGALAGAGVGAVSALAGKVISWGVGKVKTRPVRDIASSLGITEDAARVLKDVSAADDFDDMMRQMQRGGPDAMLVDASPVFKGLADTSVQTSPAAMALGRSATKGRAVKVADDLTNVLDDVLGKPVGKTAAVDAIREGGRTARKTAFDASYRAPIDYSKPAGIGLERLLKRVPGSVIRRANARMNIRGKQSSQIMAEILDNDTVRYSVLPDSRQIHLIAQEIDGMVSKPGKGALGGFEGYESDLMDLSLSLRNQFKIANPAFKKASDAFADEAAEARGVMLGYDLLAGKMRRDQVKKAIYMTTGAAETKAIKQGMRDYVDDILSRAQNAIGRPENEITEAMKALKMLTTREAKDKMEIVLGTSGAKRIASQMDAVGAALEARGSIAAGSQTYGRKAGADAYRAISKGSAVDDVLEGLGQTGSPGFAARTARKVFGKPEKMLTQQQQKMFKEITDVLVSMQGPKATGALRLIQDRAKRMNQPMVSDGIKKLIDDMSGGAVVGGYSYAQDAIPSRLGVSR